MSAGDTIAFSRDLTPEQNRQLKCIAEYNKRSMGAHFEHMIETEYEKMKKDLK